MPKRSYTEISESLEQKLSHKEGVLLSESEAALYSGLSLKEFREYRSKGVGPEDLFELDSCGFASGVTKGRKRTFVPYFQFGGKVYYSIEAMDAWNRLIVDGRISLEGTINFPDEAI